MRRQPIQRLWANSPWTWSLVGLLILLNLGLFRRGPDRTVEWLTLLQFDGTAIRAGELWRLLTANLVHFNPNHFFLDVGVFVVLGFLYERSFRGFYPWLLLMMALSGFPNNIGRRLPF